MRPWRQVFAFGCCLCLTIFCLYNSASTGSAQRSPYDTQSKNRLSAFFSFRTPGSLFPLNALISLTDENSTFFSARPANFGPLLPSRGLDGQLWIGNGFGDGAFSRRGIAAGAEGELGCSDALLLGEGSRSSVMSLDYAQWQDEQTTDPRRTHRRRSISQGYKKFDDLPGNLQEFNGARSDASKDDGTDNYLHESSTIAVTGSKHSTYAKGGLSSHADIQSLQESAEINGKIVLLSRGGCGFFEKVKWAQRRGAIAVIVADNIPGGALVTMNAKEDTSNITIPSVFTHHTTAHILASLIPPGFDSVTPALSKPGSISSSKNSKSFAGSDSREDILQNKGVADEQLFTETATSALHTPTTRPSSHESSTQLGEQDSTIAKKPGWWSLIWSIVTFGYGSTKDSSDGFHSRRPPSSGNLDWLMVENWDNDEPKLPKTTISPSKSQGPEDGFVIGIQDWRDPDVVSSDGKISDRPDSTNSKASSRPTDLMGSNAITPGSGEYSSSSFKAEDVAERSRLSRGKQHSDISDHSGNEGGGWLKSLGWGFAHADDLESQSKSDKHHSLYHPAAFEIGKTDNQKSSAEIHEGLWVTLTPSSISTSPFFDTLIVLVVSPLVTLTIVYAMLLIRSRIRRRRWRAPKSLVDQLPVRTYHIQSTRSSSPGPSMSTVVPYTSTTPLLAGARQIETRSRPRSRTIGDSPDSLSVPSGYGSLDSIAEQEKLDAGLAEWRRRYGGRQVECIVCLEEYVDGVSKVMSLPCGHEFHAECITPWLTTRRRTCPICKGDVVRSMTKSPPAKIANASIDGDGDDNYQIQAAETVNESPSASMPINAGALDNNDLERGEEPTLASRSLPTLRLSRNLGNSLHALHVDGGKRNATQRPRSPADEGRDR